MMENVVGGRAAALTAAELLPDPAVCLDGSFRLLWANGAAEDTFGWSCDDMLGDVDMLSIVHPDDLNIVLTSAETITGKDVGSLVELRLRTASGAYKRLELRGRSIVLPDESTGYVLVLRDVADRHGWDLSAGSADLLRTVMEASSTPVMVCDIDGVVTSASAALVRFLGWDRERTIGRPFTDLVAAEHVAAVDACFRRSADDGSPDRQRCLVLDTELMDTASTAHPYRLEISDLRDDPAVQGFVVFAHDVSDLKAALKTLERLALRDPLTGLANRQALLDELRRRLDVRRGNILVLFCDLDGFKAVNDLLGHSRGDALLCEVAQRLKRAVRPGDLVARLGGDEFVIVCNVPNEADVDGIIERVERAAGGQVGTRRTDSEPVASASVGAVLVTDYNMTAEEALAEADSEMYRMKAWRQGLDVLPATVSERRRIASELVVALNNGEIVTHFQPVVEISSSVVTGFESLVRWEHPTRGLLGPGDFMAVCEEAGFGDRVASVVVTQAAEFAASIPDHLFVAVNLSALQLANSSVPQMVIDEFTGRGVDLSRVVVEVPERNIVGYATRDGGLVLDVLNTLREAGVAIAIDDFGTGAASLTSIVTLPVTALKVDRSLTSRACDDPAASALVRAVASLASELGFSVVAEGVETQQQADLVKSLGCCYAQGYLYHSVLPPTVAAQLVSATEPSATI